MANNRIKGLTVEIGGDTTNLGKALEKANSKANDLQSELGEINRQLKFDPSNTELLGQKYRVLGDLVEQTSDKLKTLKEAEKQVQEQFLRGDVSAEQVRALRREIIATEDKLKNYEASVKKAEKEVKNLGKTSEDTSGKMADILGKGFVAAGAGVTAATAAITAAVESTREYRTDMGKLEVAFTNAGHNAEAATKTYQALQGVLGDSAQAVEAANHLAQLATNEEDLAKWTEIATGVFATFGTSLPVENITEAANETAKTGKVVGGLADAINWSKASADQWKVALGGNAEALKAFETATAEGMSAEDAFNEALAACTTEQERQALITNTLTGLYSGASASYKELNADVIAANEANEKMTASLAEVGAKFEPLVTQVKELGAELLSRLVPVIDAIINNLPALGVLVGGAAAAFVTFKVAAIAATAATQGMTLAQYALAAAQGVLNAVMSANPIGLVILGVTALTAAILVLVKNWDAFREFFVKGWEAIRKVVGTVVDWIKENWSTMLLFLMNPLAGVFKYCYEHFDGFRAKVDSVFAKVKTAFSGFVDGLKAIPGKISSFVNSVVTKLQELPGKAISIGKDLVSGLWKGISDKFDWLKKKLAGFASSTLDGIKEFFGVHSPSTETAWIGEMLDEGMAKGVNDNADKPLAAMDRLSSEMLDEAAGDDLNIERRVSHTFGAVAPTTDSGLLGRLDKILAAIESGKSIYIDGDTLVGATARQYDITLGQRRVLAERGAI